MTQRPDIIFLPGKMAIHALLLFLASGVILSRNVVHAQELSPEEIENAAKVNRRGIVPEPHAEDQIGNAAKTISTPCIAGATGSGLSPAVPCPPLKAAEASPPFSALDQETARLAWAYFQSARNSSTGLFDSISKYHAATMWDVGSGLAGLVSAFELGLTTHEEFNGNMKAILKTLQQISLYNGELPNREYDVRKGHFLDAHSRASSRGSGWSSLDIGRLLIWLKIIAQWYPELKEPAEAVVRRWRFDRLRLNGQSNGVLLDGNSEKLRQEGRLGYEQYAAAGYALWSVPLPEAQGYKYTEPFQVLEVPLLRDKRDLAYLTSEPFILATLELGPVDPVFDGLVQAVYQVQQKRWQTTGVLTAASEDAIDQEPWFLYNTISFGNDAWVCISPGGHLFPRSRTLSTKAAMAWSVIYDDDYARLLRAKVQDLNDSALGYFAGVYEGGGANESLNINTNAVILEAMLYRKLGRRPFLAVRDRGPNEQRQNQPPADSESARKQP